jgi:transposase
MRKSTKYVGLDVHQATTVASVREGSGRLIARSVIPTEGDSLLEFFGGMRGSVHVAFEEGTQAQWLHDLLVPVVHEVLVCDRRGESKRGNKGDLLDCDELSELLRRGALRPVYHGSPSRAALKELVRTYLNVAEDSVRTMQRIKALFRARAIRTRGAGVYGARERSDWLAKLPDEAVRFRAEVLYAQLDLLKSLRHSAKAAMIAEGRKDPAWRVLQTIPYLGPVRAALLLAIMQTPWRFRTKRQLWAYAGLAVVTRSSSDFEIVDGRAVRRRRRPLTRGLNRNHNRVLKNVFKGMAAGAIGKRGVLQDFYRGMLARGMREELARVTLARKLAAITLRLWKNGECFDPSELRAQAR